MPNITGKLAITQVEGVSISFSTNTVCYTVPRNHIASFLLYAVPYTGTGTTDIRVAIIQGSTVGDVSDENYIIYDLTLTVNEAYKLDKIALGSDQSLVVWADQECTFTLYGEQEESALKAGILGSPILNTTAAANTVYTCPDDKSAVVTAYATNITSGSTTTNTRIYVNTPRFTGVASPTSPANALRYDESVAPGERLVVPNIQLGPGEGIIMDDAQAPANQALAFGVYGVEETLW